MTVKLETMRVHTESIRGVPYMSAENLAKEFGLSKVTVRKRTSEIEDQIQKGRYNDYAVLKDGKIVLINQLVFIDYLKYRKMLNDKNASRYTPAFDPAKVLAVLGWSNRHIMLEGGES